MTHREIAFLLYGVRMWQRESLRFQERDPDGADALVLAIADDVGVSAAELEAVLPECRDFLAPAIQKLINAGEE